MTMPRISIHAPLAGRDYVWPFIGTETPDFNPRAPCGARPWFICACMRPGEFQSTRPLRGATWAHWHPRARWRFQSTRPLRGATSLDFPPLAYLRISIHAPLAGRDATITTYSNCEIISIHAPLAGRDGGQRGVGGGQHHFNPRAPCGARRFEIEDSRMGMIFQSTRPLRGATQSSLFLWEAVCISIHAPLAGRDGILRRNYEKGVIFQSTRPLRGATAPGGCC